MCENSLSACKYRHFIWKNRILNQNLNEKTFNFKKYFVTLQTLLVIKLPVGGINLVHT